MRSELSMCASAGKELGARYVMEGSLRQAGAKLRIAVQLVDATTGAHLWAETYDRPFSPEAIFELQDEARPAHRLDGRRDAWRSAPQHEPKPLRNRDPDQLTPYEALLRSFAYFIHVNASEPRGGEGSAGTAVEAGARKRPTAGLCCPSLYREEYNHGFNVRPDPVGRALGCGAARRGRGAVQSPGPPRPGFGPVFSPRNCEAFRSAAKRALQLNPMDGYTIGYHRHAACLFRRLGARLCADGAGSNLNPNHPGWYWFATVAIDAYRKQDYRAALEFRLKVNMPGFWRDELALAAIYGQLGEADRRATRPANCWLRGRILPLLARRECSKWWDARPGRADFDGLRKAGLERFPKRQEDRQPSRSSLSLLGYRLGRNPRRRRLLGGGAAVQVQRQQRRFEGAGRGTDAEEVITGLSRFSYLRVIARGSTQNIPASRATSARSARNSALAM